MSIAEQQNAVNPVPPGSWWEGVKDYVSKINPGNLANALMRANPVTGPYVMMGEAGTPQGTENARVAAGQVTRIPFDLASMPTGLYSLLSQGVNYATGSQLPGGEGAGDITRSIQDYGKSIGEDVAGKPLTDSVLVGTGPELLGNWLRLAGGAIPAPQSVALPIINAASKLQTGIRGVDAATRIGGKVLEAATPLTISATPGKAAVTNLAVQGAIAPAADVGFGGLESYLTGGGAVPQVGSATMQAPNTATADPFRSVAGQAVQGGGAATQPIKVQGQIIPPPQPRTVDQIMAKADSDAWLALAQMSGTPDFQRIATMMEQAGLIPRATPQGAPIVQGVPQQQGGVVPVANAQVPTGATQGVPPSGSRGVTQPGTALTVQPEWSVTGSRTLDAIIGTAGLMLGGYAVVNGHARDVFKRMTQGTDRALTGYDPRLPENQTYQAPLVRFQQQFQNDQASIYASWKKMLEADGMNPEAARLTVDKMREEAAGRRGAGLSTRAESLSTEGKFLNSTHVLNEPLNDTMVKYGRLSPDQQELMRKAQWAEDELINRQRAMTKQFNRPGLAPQSFDEAGLLAAEGRAASTPMGASQFQQMYATNLANYSSRQLKDLSIQARSDPAIRPIMDAYNDAIAKSIQYRGEQRLVTQAEANELLRNNPRYVPPTRSEAGRFNTYIDERGRDFPQAGNFDANSGQYVARGLPDFNQLGNPMHDLPKYMDSVLRATEGMKIKRDFMTDAIRMRDSGNPVARELIGRDVRLAADAGDRATAWRDTSGNLKHTEINDAVLRQSLSGVTNPTALQMQHGLLTAATKLFESGAVGPLSLAHGTFFPIKSIAYSMAGTMLPRPQGVSMGWFDKAIRGATKGKVGVPDWPTMFLDAVLLRAPANIGAILAERASRVMHNSVMTNGMLTKMMPPATLQRYADGLHHWYKQSYMAEMQQAGLMGPASFTGAVDRAKMFNNPAASLEKKNALQKTSTFLNDMFHAIGSAPGSSIMAMNKELLQDPTQAWKVTSAIRNLTGDPGQSGAFVGRGGKALASAVNMTPWGNVYIQSMAKLASSFRDPATAAKTLASISTGIGIPTAMASMWNASLGPEYVEYQHLNRSPDQHFGNIYVGIPGRPPNEGYEHPIDPLMRPFKQMYEGITAASLGLFSGEFFRNPEMQKVISDMVHHRYLGNPLDRGSMLHSALTQTLLPPPPAVAQAGAGALGMNLGSYIDASASATNKRAGFVAGTSPDPGKGMNSEVMPSHLEDVLRGIGASGAVAVYQFFTGMRSDMNWDAPLYGNQRKTMGEAFGNQAREWSQSFKDSLVGGNALFGSRRAVTPSQEASASIVKDKLDGIRSIVEAYSATESKQYGAMGDWIGNKKGGFEQLLGAMPRQPNSPDEAAFAREVAGVYKDLQPALHEIKMAYNQRQSIMNDNTMTPDQKRVLLNRMSYNIIDTHRRMLQDITRIEYTMSQRYGTRIDFGKMNRGSLSDETNPPPE